MKIALLVGVVIVVLLTGAVVLGAAGDDANGFADRLGGVAGRRAVDRSDIVAGCVDEHDPNLLDVTGSCSIVVVNDGDVRLLRMVAVDSFEVEAPAPAGALHVGREVDPGDEVAVAVREGETAVSIGCVGGAEEHCLVRLEAE